MLSVFFSLGNTTVSADSNDNSSENKYIIESIESIICDNVENCEVVNKDLKINKEKVYDLFLNNIGHIYEFESEEHDVFGYLISRRRKISNDWIFEISEMVI